MIYNSSTFSAYSPFAKDASFVRSHLSSGADENEPEVRKNRLLQPRIPLRRARGSPNASCRAGMGKRGHRGKKDGEGTKPPAEKKRSVHDVTELFVKGGDIKDLGRRATGAFAADALEKRYKHEGTTVDVDKNFSFKDLVTEAGGGGSFSLFGALGGGEDAGVAKADAEGAREDDKTPSAADARGGGGSAGGAGDGAAAPSTSRGAGDAIASDSKQPSEAERLRAAAVARRAAAVAAAQRARDSGLVRARKTRGGDGDGDGDKERASSYASVLGIGPGILEAARAFRRPFATESDMVEAWHATRDDAREEYKRRRRQALRRQKSLRAAGTGARR